jgi:hypothetical protein
VFAGDAAGAALDAKPLPRSRVDQESRLRTATAGRPLNPDAMIVEPDALQRLELEGPTAHEERSPPAAEKATRVLEGEMGQPIAKRDARRGTRTPGAHGLPELLEWRRGR